jgi:predicted ATPase
LVGPNGAGKSNFLDALRFPSEAMSPALESVLQNRGGVASILRRGQLGEGHLGIRVEFVTRTAEL